MVTRMETKVPGMLTKVFNNGFLLGLLVGGLGAAFLVSPLCPLSNTKLILGF